MFKIIFKISIIFYFSPSDNGFLQFDSPDLWEADGGAGRVWQEQWQGRWGRPLSRTPLLLLGKLFLGPDDSNVQNGDDSDGKHKRWQQGRLGLLSGKLYIEPDVSNANSNDDINFKDDSNDDINQARQIRWHWPVFPVFWESSLARVGHPVGHFLHPSPLLLPT